jgi:hypothetical protein
VTHVSGMERIARAASALPLADGAYAVTWEADGQWHTAFCDNTDSIPAATLATVAVARDGAFIAVETTETTETRMESVR